MIEPAWCSTMAGYNRWMNVRLYAICAGLTDEARKQDRGAFFKSVHSTLNHLLWGDRNWLGRFSGQAPALPGIGTDLYADFDELRRERDATDTAILAWADDLTPQWLATDYTWKSGIDGLTRTLPFWVLVTQMFNHQTHHRGQLTTLLSQLGIDPGETDLPWLPALNAVRDRTA
jgi:uncharacterized damage-inducible protein DinB